MDFKSAIRVIEGFPKPGISFKDITTLLKQGESGTGQPLSASQPLPGSVGQR